MPRVYRPDDENPLGLCQKEGCRAPLTFVEQTLIGEEKTAPLFKDGTPNLFAPWEQGETALRVFLIEEHCAQGHRGQWERYIPSWGALYAMPIVFLEPNMVYNSDLGWTIEGI